MGNIELNPGDLTGNDTRIFGKNFSDLQFIRVTDFAQKEFETGYQALWEEFAGAGEMESVEATKKRLSWDPRRPEIKEYPMLCEMAVAKEKERCVAVTNTTAIVDMTESTPRLNILFNHIWVHADYRRTGLSSWMRTMPWQVGRRCLSLLGIDEKIPMTILAEVEHSTQEDDFRQARLLTWEKAGYMKLDPQKVPYAQPDFRLREDNLACGVTTRCLPLALLMYQKEMKKTSPAKEVKKMATCLHYFYDQISEVWRMAPVWDTLKLYPVDKEDIELVAPTARR